MVARCTKVPVRVSTQIMLAVSMIATPGTRVPPLTRANTEGISPCSASANSTRGVTRMEVLRFPAQESTAVTATTVAPAAPKIASASSAMGRLVSARPGSIDWQASTRSA